MVHGRVSGKASLAVDGQVEGDVSLDGGLAVGRGGRVTASLELETLVVEGWVRGEVVARAGVAVRSGGALEGTVHAPRVALDVGARLEGQVLTVGGDPAPGVTTAATGEEPSSGPPRRRRRGPRR